MSDIHLTREILLAGLRGELSSDVVQQIALQHLTSLCPHCRKEYRAFQREIRGGGPLRYELALFLPLFLKERIPRLEREQQRARRDLRALLSLAPEERAPRVARSRSRFRGAELARLLIEESERRVHLDPDEAFHLADLARHVANRSPHTLADFTPLALAFAAMGNAQRAKGALRKAEPLFEFVRSVIRQHGVTDLEVIARVDELEGSLRKDQRRFTESEQLLTRAVMLYRLMRSKNGQARALIKLGTLYYAQGDLDRAIGAVRKALRNLRGEAISRLYLNARFNLTFYLAELGHYHQAADALRDDEELYRSFQEPWTQLRLLWLRGRIAVGLGDLAFAEEAFLAAQQGFLDQGIRYDAALVTVGDLAPLYLSQGRTAEVKRLAEEMFPVFQAQDVHREALAALLLFQQAARREELTLQRVREIAKYLQEARNDPSLPFGEQRK